MPPRQQSRFLSRGNSSRRKTGWSVGPSQPASRSFTANGAALWATGAVIGLDGLTVVRTRGSITSWLEVVTSIGDGFQRVGHGIALVTAEAFAVGITAVPLSIMDMDWDGWLWHTLQGPLIGLSVTESDNTGPLSQVRLEIDSKAMRKQMEGMVEIGVTEVLGEIGAATLVFVADTRSLDKIP